MKATLPTLFPNSVKLMDESATGKELEVSQQQFNTNSTVVQHHSNVELVKKTQTIDEVKNVVTQEFIQQTTNEKGERVGVEQAQFNGVLQTEQQVDSIATQKDISSQSNSQALTLGQEAFQQKYQSVEILNRDGEWVKDYCVHKCLVVANLEGVERKYALVDESGRHSHYTIS